MSLPSKLCLLCICVTLLRDSLSLSRFLSHPIVSDLAIPAYCVGMVEAVSRDIDEGLQRYAARSPLSPALLLLPLASFAVLFHLLLDRFSAITNPKEEPVSLLINRDAFKETLALCLASAYTTSLPRYRVCTAPTPTDRLHTRSRLHRSCILGGMSRERQTPQR
jgi:hypothetical protein